MIRTENEAQDWVHGAFDVPRETMALFDAFVSLLRAENEHQNLVSRASLDTVWARHIADSLQLLHFAPFATASWLDLGTGAGFPGLMIAVVHRGPVTLVESRKLRVAFLERAAAVLKVRPRILHSRLEQVTPEAFDVISARAFAQSGQLLELSHRFASPRTRWILPKGRSAQSELEQVKATWQGDFRLEPSLTDPDARIIVAEGVGPKRKSS